MPEQRAHGGALALASGWLDILFLHVQLHHGLSLTQGQLSSAGGKWGEGTSSAPGPTPLSPVWLVTCYDLFTTQKSVNFSLTNFWIFILGADQHQHFFKLSYEYMYQCISTKISTDKKRTNENGSNKRERRIRAWCRFQWPVEIHLYWEIDQR